MTSNTGQNPIQENQTPEVRPGTYSPVTVHLQDTMGTLLLGILSIILLVGWIRAEKRNRSEINQKSEA